MIQRVWDDNQQVYGPRKVWRQLRRERSRVARCTVRRLMRALGLVGAGRGRAWVTTTHADQASARPPDLVDRQFTATRPNQLWVSDFTYVATWGGLCLCRLRHRRLCPAHRRLARLGVAPHGLRARCPRASDLRPRSARRPTALIHHSDRGTQYLSMAYTIAWPTPTSLRLWAAVAIPMTVSMMVSLFGPA